ncbi:MAG TPA: protease pro-enzyme activation domain-containing protein [Candidatus Solibacter sp.]|nr:protease pro-enzyme activation domain-containing protein [Candidatus Solibacter sp.]
MRKVPPSPRLVALISVALLSFTSSGLAQQKLQVLHNHVRPAVANGQAAPVGLLPSNQRLHLAIELPLRNQSELTDFLSRLDDPNSPDFHQFLSVQQFTEQFGPTQQDYQEVIDFAKANGFKITDTPKNRRLVDISGTVDQIEKAFHVAMVVYQHPTENRTFFSPDREPSLDLTVPVSHIAGLNDYSIPHSQLRRPPADWPIHSNAGSGPGGAYLAGDMRAAYYGGSALTGSGQSVALCEFDGYNMSDVTATFDGVNYTVPITNVLIDGASSGSDGDDGEQVLDIVQAIGMAPGLSAVRVYIAPGTTSIGVGDKDMFNKMATDNISKQIGCSWGWNPDDTSSDDPIFQEFAAQGQNMFVASGDAGAYTGSNSTDESYPAESVYVVAVGGTDLTTSGPGGSWVSEVAWPDSSGGPSDNGFAIPSWQSGIANSSNGASSTIRDLPDVAMEGNFDNYLCDNGSCMGDWGGTSFAAPRWAGFLALINQQVVANGGSTLGFVNPAIYAVGKSTNFTTDFHDITSGNNNNGHGKSYNAVVGYDMVTGWGSPNGQNLINALAGATTQSFTLSASPSSVTINQGGNGTSTITVTDVGGFTGSVTLAASGLPSGVTAGFSPNPTTGTSTLTLTASSTATTGTATVTITGTSGSLSAQTTVSLTVNATGTANFTIGASPSSLTITQGGNGTSTITITSQNGFNSATALTASGLPSGVTAAFNPTSVTPPANGSATSVLTLTASSTATTGNATVTVTGTSGSLSHSTTIALTVNSSTGAQTAVYSSTLKAPECATVGISCDSGPSLLLGRDHISGGAEPNQPNTINNSCADGTTGTFHSDESNDRLVIASTSGGPLTHGTTATVTATVWAYTGFTSDALDLYSAPNANSPTWTLIKTIIPTKAGAQTLSATFTLPTGTLQAVRAQFRYLGRASSCTTGSYNDHDDLIFAVQ